MQQKFNNILWTLIPCLLLFFIVLSFYNSKKIKKYELSWLENENVIKVTVFDNEEKDWDFLLQTIKKRKSHETDEINRIREIKNMIDTNSYMIQVNDSVMVGSHYNSDKYQVATTDKNGNLFKIIALENQTFLTEEVENNEFDKILVISKYPEKIQMILLKLTELSLEEGKKMITNETGVEAYWLLANKEVGHIKGKQH